MLRDLTFAARLLVKSPGFSLVTILSLALGIGANAAIFSLVDAILLRPLPVEEPARLVSVFTTDARNPGNLPLSHLNYQDLRDRNTVQPNFDWYDTRRGLFLFSFGRLRDGVAIEEARANLSTLFTQLEQAFPDDNRGRSAGAVPLLDARLNPQGQAGAPVVRMSILLMTVVGIVLLIACANIANLLLARASRRRREIAVRLALGAPRRRLLRQLLTESVLLSMLGAVAGVVLAYWLLDILRATALPLPVPVDDTTGINARVLFFTGGLAVMTGLLFGIAPALRASSADVLATLKSELGPAGAGRRGQPRLRQVLVIAQVAASLVALVAAAMFLRGLRDAQAIDPGFETRGVLIANVNLGREGYTAERGQIYDEQAVERLRAVPGVRHAGVAQNAPFAGGFLRSIFLEGADTTTRDRVLVQVNSVSPGYLETIGVPLLRGRDIERSDGQGTPPVVVINDQMAQQFWPSEDAVGKRFRFFGAEVFTTVIGVARTAKYNGVAEDPIPFIYQPLGQNYTPAGTIHVRTDGPAAALAPSVRAALVEIDPTLALFNIQTLENTVADALAPLRTNVILLTGFGARPGSVLGLVLTQGLVLVGAGLAVGLVAALALSTLFPAGLLGNTNPRDPATIALTAILLSAVAVVATYVPARRATRIDPLIALRTE